MDILHLARQYGLFGTDRNVPVPKRLWFQKIIVPKSPRTETAMKCPCAVMFAGLKHVPKWTGAQMCILPVSFPVELLLP